MSDYEKKIALKQQSACNYCHERKIRCDKQKPQCSKCLDKNVQCVYGERLKRGPKGPREIALKKELKINADQPLKIIKKSTVHLDAMHFELEFNKKMAELWQNLSQRNTGLKARPDFRPQTEEFIKSPEAPAYLMEEFNATCRLMYIDANHFAPNLDFATKIWQAIIQINFADFLTIVNGFPTPLLLSILEYLIMFALGLKSNYYDDAAEYMIRIAHSIVNTILYSRDGTNDTLTPELTPQLVISLGLIVSYYRLCENYFGSKSTSMLIFDLYEQNKHKGIFNKEYENRTRVRRLFHECWGSDGLNEDLLIEKIQQLEATEGPITSSPTIQYYINYHLSFTKWTSQQDLRSADTCIQKAEYFINWYINQSPPEKRDQVRDIFHCKLDALHAEIAIRLGNADLAKAKVGSLIQLYARAPHPVQRMIIHRFTLYHKHHWNWSFDFLSLLKLDANLDHRALPISEASSHTDNISDEYEVIEEEENHSNEIPLSFNEFLDVDLALDLNVDFNPLNNDVGESYLEEVTNQYTIL